MQFVIKLCTEGHTAWDCLLTVACAQVGWNSSYNLLLDDVLALLLSVKWVSGKSSAGQIFVSCADWASHAGDAAQVVRQTFTFAAFSCITHGRLGLLAVALCAVWPFLESKWALWWHWWLLLEVYGTSCLAFLLLNLAGTDMATFTAQSCAQLSAKIAVLIDQ